MVLKRRDFVNTTTLSGCALLLGMDPRWLNAQSLEASQQPFTGGKLLGQAEFLNEGPAEMDTAFGSELDGRLYTSLNGITEGELVTSDERFYIRTRASQVLPPADAWHITVDGLVTAKRTMKIREVQSAARPLGMHLMECAGNTRAAHFGMISVGDWAGMPVAEILAAARPADGATQVLVSGFDRYVTNSVTSTPGASWIFRLEELANAGAFLATQLNGAPISRDHGAPVRLVVPSWYGCACIKWVELISLVNDSVAATAQMQEYAGRTHQNGNPRLAKDYVSPRIEHAAMPVRVEQWVVGGKIRYRIVGLLWGGRASIRKLGIRFNPEEEYVDVDLLEVPQKRPWTMWSHTWKPAAPGRYTIRLAVKDPELHPKRLESGYYARTVEISEV
ncbi:MAG TPA: molybdopterin-dependent oxidoreductase [Terriglobia bacterium]|nr:molybdopterin-dependent oxidoreductase [Terriglobia bacterium]